jgi:hypothetical protein
MIFSDDDYASATALKWRAEYLVALGRATHGGALTVPLAWTAFLLMDKAGVPRALVAELSETSPAALAKRIRAARALMIFPPFAARIERLMRSMPRFGIEEALCAG